MATETAVSGFLKSAEAYWDSYAKGVVTLERESCRFLEAVLEQDVLLHRQFQEFGRQWLKHVNDSKPAETYTKVVRESLEKLRPCTSTTTHSTAVKD